MFNITEIANRVDKLVKDQDVRTRFLNHINRFYAMAESYGRSLQPYLDELKKTAVQIEQYSPEQIQEYRDQRPDSPGINLYDVCPPPEGWIKTDNSCCNSFFEFDYLVSYRPTEYPNPVLWLGVVGSSAVQRKPTDTEKLTCAYVLLAIAHDYNLNKDLNTPIFQAEYKGKWFKRDVFLKSINIMPNIWGKYFKNQDNLPLLECAYNDVLKDIKSPNNKGLDYTWENNKTDILSFIESALKKPKQKKSVAIRAAIEYFNLPNNEKIDMERWIRTEYDRTKKVNKKMNKSERRKSR